MKSILNRSGTWVALMIAAAILATKAARENGVDSLSFVITLAVGMCVVALGIA